MGDCLHCGAEVPVGFSTCSSDCAVKTGNGEPSLAQEARVYDTAPEGVALVDTEEVARRLGLSTQTIRNWKQSGKIPCYRLGPKTTRYDYQAVCKALGGAPPGALKDPYPDPDPVGTAFAKGIQASADAHKEGWRLPPSASGAIGAFGTSTPYIQTDYSLQTELEKAVQDMPPGKLVYHADTDPIPSNWIERGIVAAREAFRDVMLERADEARARGDHRERAEALEDYIFFEEGLKLVYERRGERQT